jgi:hypothetical protein
MSSLTRAIIILISIFVHTLVIHAETSESLRKKLVAGLWQADTINLRFYKSGEFELQDIQEGGAESGRGKFKIEADGKIDLSFSPNSKTDVEAHKWQGPNSLQCTYTYKTDDKRPEHILCTGRDFDFANMAANHKPGTLVQIFNRPLIAISKKGKVSEIAKIREEPAVSSAAREYCIATRDYQGEERDNQFLMCKPHLPKGKIVEVLFRTQDKEKIQKWENYWYYVRYEFQRHNSSCGCPEKDSAEAWIFGEFVKIN